MKIKWNKRIWICLLSMAIVVFPISTAGAVGKGAKGADVYTVQGMLASLGIFKGTIDGFYGTVTYTAVQQFQARVKLPATGTVDAQTLKSILWAYENLRAPTQSTAAPSKAPVYTAAPAPIQTPAPKPSSYPLTGLTDAEQTMVQLVNQARAQAGLGPLMPDSALTQTARLKSQDMVNLNYFAHQSPTYGSPFEMMTQFGINYRSAGENIACNQSVAAAHQALMNSQGHRDNILNTGFNYIGIGIIRGGPCGEMYTQEFVGR